MILAVDYDGTLELRDEKGRKVMNLALISHLRKAQRQGHTIILWSCRAGPRLQEALTALRNCGLVPNLVNQNAPQSIARLGYDPRKVLADVYIDDKGARSWPGM